MATRTIYEAERNWATLRVRMISDARMYRSLAARNKTEGKQDIALRFEAKAEVSEGVLRAMDYYEKLSDDVARSLAGMSA